MAHVNIISVIIALAVCLVQISQTQAEETVLSSALTPTSDDTIEKQLNRQGRSYYDRMYGARPLYDRQENDRPSRCGRCDDRDDDYDRPRDRYDDDRRMSHRPTYGDRYDSNRDYDNDRRYNSDRRNMSQNGTDSNANSDKKMPYDDNNDNRLSGSRRNGDRDGNRYDDRDRNRHNDRDRNRDDRDRDRYDDRDRYRPDYYDRFLRNPYRDRNYDRPYYDDGYRERKPLFEQYPFDRYDEGYRGKLDGYGYSGYRRPVYEDRFDRGNGYDDAFGGYGPGIGRGPHDSFRPWDETYRGQAGWDAGGRGYYFASGRPEPSAAGAWASSGRPDYNNRPGAGGWQSLGYGTATGYRDQLEYRVTSGYGGGGVGGGVSGGYGGSWSSSGGYGRPSGWHSINERRPYRDQSAVSQVDNKGINYDQNIHGSQPGYGQNQASGYGQGQSSGYGQSTSTGYGQGTSSGYGQGSASHSSTTPATSYLYEREDQQALNKKANDTSKPT